MIYLKKLANVVKLLEKDVNVEIFWKYAIFWKIASVVRSFPEIPLYATLS